MNKRLKRTKGALKRASKATGRVAGAAARATAAGAQKAASATFDAANVAGRIALAAALGNAAEKVLAIEAHDVMRDIGLAHDEGGATVQREGYSLPDVEVAKFMKAVGNAVWRLERRMIDEEMKEPKEEFRKIWRPVSAIKDALEDIGVEVIDMTGRRYDEGLPLKVVSEEERPSLKEPDICEMLSPVIRFRKQTLLQQGEVVVGRPAGQTTNASIKEN